MVKHYTASGIIFHEDKILLLKHKRMNTWVYPGGHVEEEESPDECLVREIMEETGYQVEILKTNSFTYSDSKAKTLCQPFCVLEEQIKDACAHVHVDFVYLCKICSNQICGQPEYEETRWFSEAEIQNLDIMENMKVVLLEAFKFLKQ